MRARQAAIDGDRLAVDVRCLVAGKEQCHMGDLLRLAIASERVELADLLIGAARTGNVEDRLRHACFDEAGADRIDAHARAVEFVRGRLHEADDACLLAL